MLQEEPPPLKSLVNEKITELYGFTAESLAAPVEDNDYGQSWPKNTPQWFKEAWAYRHSDGLDKLYHMVNMIKIDLPFFEFQARGYINSNALRVLKALCDNNDLGIAGAASTGKTFPVGAYILEAWKSAPDVSLAFVCTTSMAASEDRIWGAIVKMWQRSVIKVGTYVPHKHVITWGAFSDSASDRDFNSAIKALAIEKGEEGRKAIDVTRGRKQHNVYLVFDELPEMETYVTLGAINLESNTPSPELNAFGLQVVGIGNSNKQTDAHGGMCRPDHPLGYKSITKDTPEWKTRTGWCIFLNGEWSPNFEAPESEPIPFPRLTNRIGLERMRIRCHGNVNSIEYWRNAIGFWPGAAVQQTVLTEELILQKKADQKAEFRSLTRKRIVGFDAGFTAGGDKCVAQFGEVGKDLFGRDVCQWIAEKVYMPEADGVFEDTIAEQLVADCIKFNVAPDGFGMDISGDGGKLLQAIIRVWLRTDPRATQIVAISSMGKATDRIVSYVDPRKCSEVFDRRVSEYWMMVREAVLCESIKGMPMFIGMELHPIVDQLCSRTYEIVNKKFRLETKPEYKETKQKDSPDNADSFCYMVEMARRHGLMFRSPEDIARVARLAREKAKQRPVVRESYHSDSWGEDDEAVAILVNESSSGMMSLSELSQVEASWLSQPHRDSRSPSPFEYALAA
jgi:hypothetical protein